MVPSFAGYHKNNTKAQFLNYAAYFIKKCGVLYAKHIRLGIERLNQGNHEPSLTIENIQERQKTYKELSLGLKSF
jgi:hypothetical protein